ncbi:MAG: hypothetical protein FGM38_01420 [Solirubrobacterales bacterium]|nr:hypothetical protein [Solirubrobacterales bacterium]
MTGREDRPIRIDRSKSGEGSFQEGETAFLRFTLDHEGVPFLDDLGGGWVSGEGPGWVLHYRPDAPLDGKETEFFPGIELVDEEGAQRAARDFLEALGDAEAGPD